ncbi:MAG: hypothetical protein IK020_12890 [Clostridiales bacterium]|nr:hypothetical protein [Clostridiales bacterium]
MRKPILTGWQTEHVSPASPDGVYNRKAGHKITALLMGILLLAIAVTLFLVVNTMP